jgi:3-methyladenine DNA glycosylase AlkC
MADALKDMYNPAFFADLTAAVNAVYPAFDAEKFHVGIYDETWEDRPLKNRVRHIAMTLRGLLPDDYRSALDVLRAAAPHLSGYGFQLMFLPDFVELYGMDDWDASLPALETFTQLCSSEFAVRPFILHDSARMMDQMLHWTEHENHHVRRLATEGCRPRLPWAMALPVFKRDPAPVLKVLECLKNDPSEYVRRSVANNLNDIAKDNPDTVIGTLRRWQTEPGEGTEWITRHALRTLIKSGHMEALDLLGYQAGSGLTVRGFQLGADTIQVGESLSFAFEIASAADAAQDLMIDYIVYFVKANGKRAPKVFKLAQRKINPGESLRIEKKHSFKPITTRVYYPGEHALALKINGQEFEGGVFILSQSG